MTSLFGQPETPEAQAQGERVKVTRPEPAEKPKPILSQAERIQILSVIGQLEVERIKLESELRRASVRSGATMEQLESQLVATEQLLQRNSEIHNALLASFRSYKIFKHLDFDRVSGLSDQTVEFEVNEWTDENGVSQRAEVDWRLCTVTNNGRFHNTVRWIQEHGFTLSDRFNACHDKLAPFKDIAEQISQIDERIRFYREMLPSQ